MDSLRIFVASPGDVELERSIVGKTIDLLQLEFDDRINLEQVIWELEPLLATAGFQEQLARPSSCDVAVFVLGNRLGTPLPPAFARPDGSLYQSGTEFEFEEAVNGYRLTGKPQILVYRNIKPQYFDLNDRQRDEIVHQRRLLDEFEKRWFIDESNSTFKGAFHQFRSTDEFEQLLENHLLKLINQMAPGGEGSQGTRLKSWIKGNPFRGLQSFTAEHAQVFFGRTKAVSECVQALRAAEQRGVPLLMALGMSGGGKSSLVHAGVVPTLLQKGVLEELSIVGWSTMRPSDNGGNPIDGVVSALQRGGLLSANDDVEVGRQIEMARHEPGMFAKLVEDAIRENTDGVAERGRGVLCVDQELYTTSAIGNEERSRFVALLDHLVRDARVWCIVTLRSDYYPAMMADPKLSAIKADGVQYDLKAPTPAELSLMIRGPATAAGLRFEQDHDTGEPLDRTIRRACEDNPEALPLLEYTLSELYEQRDDGFLTVSAYNALGGVEGALASTAERCYKGLADSARRALPLVFNTIIEFTERGNHGRRWVQLDSLANEQTRGFIDAFVAARLFVLELDAEANQIVTVSHESLFRHWPRLQQWVDINQEQIRIRSRLDAAANLWAGHDRATDLLLGEGRPVEDGEQLLSSGLTVSPATEQFIGASMRRARRRKGLRLAGMMAVALFAIVAMVEAYQANQSSQDAMRRLSQNEDLVAFLLDDLIEELKPIGRLDLLRSVGEKTIAFFGTINDRDLTDVARVRHVQALRQIGEVYFDAGQFEAAVAAFEQSLRQIDTLHRLEPGDTDRLFELGQAHYWVGFSHWYLKKLDLAEAHLKRYLDISARLVEAEPLDTDRKVELAYGYGNLGALANDRHDFGQALSHFLRRATIFEELSRAFPERSDLKYELAGTQSWLGSLYWTLGETDKSFENYLKEERIYLELLAKEPNADWQIGLVHAYRHLGENYIQAGRLDRAIDILSKGNQSVEELVTRSPENTRWQFGKAITQLNLARALHFVGDTGASSHALTAGRRALDAMTRIDGENRRWQVLGLDYGLQEALLLAAEGRAGDSMAMLKNLIDQAAAMETMYADREITVMRARMRLVLAQIARSGRSEIDEAVEHITPLLASNQGPELVTLMAFAHLLKGDEKGEYQRHLDWLAERDLRPPELRARIDE